MNYYNEFDPKAATWLRELIKSNQIPQGHVDERSIVEVTPEELKGYTQCHFFCGISGWPLSLALAGWSEDRPIWTASLPCQPFSTAGKQAGTEDDRHLWPVFERLVRECRPPTIIGEQVASKIARDQWFPGVCLDLEALGYSVAGADLCAPCAGEIAEGRIVRGDQEAWEPIILGAPHIRQRLYWVAHTDSERRIGIDPLLRPEGARRAGASEVLEAAGLGTDGRMADAHCLGELRDARRGDEGTRPERESLGRGLLETGGDGAHPNLGMDDTRGGGRKMEVQQLRDGGEPHSDRKADFAGGSSAFAYANSIAIPCRDGKARRIEPGIFPLVNGLPRGVVPSGDPGDSEYANATSEARAMRLKGYGNAIVAPLAAMFISTCMEILDQ